MGRNTIRRQRDFDRIFATGRRHRSRLLTAVVVRGDPTAPARAAFVVSRRVSRLAVVRNRIKRRLRESFAALQAGVSPGTEVVLIAHAAAVAASYSDLSAAMRKLLMAAESARAATGDHH